jgi:hypothetical protein
VIGFETIGNATVTCFDGDPILTTDPWIKGSAYFGSWGMSHEIPAEQLENIRSCRYAWFSHGHPDHLHGDSVAEFGSHAILLPNHAGSRIRDDLVGQGFQVEVLPDRRWRHLSPHIKVMCIPDYRQDAVLLIDIKGVLVINTNDASNHGWQGFVQRVAKEYKVKWLLRLNGYGDADMINVYTEDGQWKVPGCAQKRPPGVATERHARLYGATHVLPFSSFHRYQREDSVWAQQYTTPLWAYRDGFTAKDIEFLPAFIRYDVERQQVTPIDPPESEPMVLPPSAFGDDWNDQLTRADVAELEAYFLRRGLLRDHIGFLRLRVGGRDHGISFNADKPKIGITFEVPRTSLMTAVRYEVFDDLLIGNFMKTTLHGLESLNTGFSPIVPRYADNGHVYTRYELARYMLDYVMRAPGYMLKYHFWERSEALFRRLVDPDTTFFRTSKRIYHLVKGPLNLHARF